MQNYLSGVLMIVATMAIGCQQQATEVTQAENVAEEEVAFNESGLPTVEISVPGMMCPHGCAPKVKEVLAKEAGVEEVKVDFESKTATLAIEEKEFDAEHAITALADYQFEGSTIQGLETDQDFAAEETVQ